MKPGSIEETTARLTIWCKRAPKGLGRVEFDSEFARIRVVNGLRFALAEAGIPFHEIDLPASTPAPLLVRYLVDQLNSLTPGVVSITGFATAFPDEVPLEDSLQILNFNRENLARPPLRQIWWMPTHFAEKFIRAVPDLNSWFIVRLHLTAVVPPPSETRPIIEQPDRVAANLEDARKRAANLVARFEQALAAGVSAKELRQNLAIPAVSALLEGGAEKEARELALTLAQKIASKRDRLGEALPSKDFFISYTSADRTWAEWIAYLLEEAGYSIVIQAWDFCPGGNFVLEMQKAAAECTRTIAVLSPQYLSSAFAAPEWAAAFATDPTGEHRTLIPVRVAPCELTGLLRQIVYIDLVDLDEAAARDKLLSGIRGTRAKPKMPPEYPGSHIPAKLLTVERPEFPGTLPSFWNMPYPRNLFFTGREEVLKQLRAALISGGEAALSGLGGIGKTQTAVEYAYQYRNDYKAVLWVKADSHEALVSDVVAIAGLLNPSAKDLQDQNLAVAAVRRWLEDSADWLLILDNADDPKPVEDFLPLNPGGHILLTSQAQVFDNLGIANPVELEKMLPDEAKKFFLKRTGRSGIEPAEIQAIEQLAQELDYLPLALEQAGACITKIKCSFQDYLASYRRRGLELLEKTGPVTGKYSKSVATTWSLNFEQVEQTSVAAADLLRVSAFLSPDKIPLELIVKGAAELSPVLSAALANVDADPLVLDEVLKPLTQYSLIRRDIASRTYDIHRLVQAVLKGGMDEATQRQWAERTVRAVNRAFPDDVELSKWPLCERLLPHAQACAELIEKWGLEFQEAARLLNQAGGYLHGRARFGQAELLHRRALAIMEKALGPDHPNVAQSLNNLAALCYTQGKYTQAEPLYRRALAIVEKTLGPEHLALAISLNNLALLYRDQGRYAEAKSPYRRALAIMEKALGPDHPNVAQSLNNLAALYYTQGKYTQAEPLYQQALAINEKVLGPEHPNVAYSLNNLALLYRDQGRYAEAESPYRRALAIVEKTLGPNHPDVATSLNNLAALYDDQDKYTQAEPLYQRALIIRENALGVEHPDVAQSLNNLAELYRAQSKYAQAEPLYKRSLEIREKALGPHHPDVANSLNNLAGLYYVQGKYAQAEPLFRRSLVIREKTLGPDHPAVATVLENYAILLREMNRGAEAAQMEARAKAIRAKHAQENPTK